VALSSGSLRLLIGSFIKRLDQFADQIAPAAILKANLLDPDLGRAIATLLCQAVGERERTSPCHGSIHFVQGENAPLLSLDPRTAAKRMMSKRLK